MWFARQVCVAKRVGVFVCKSRFCSGGPTPGATVLGESWLFVLCVLVVPVCFRHFLSPRARYSVTLKVSTIFFTVDDCVFKHFCFSSLRVLVLCTKIMNYFIVSIFCPHSWHANILDVYLIGHLGFFLTLWKLSLTANVIALSYLWCSFPQNIICYFFDRKILTVAQLIISRLK